MSGDVIYQVVCPINGCDIHGFEDWEQLAHHFLFDHSNQQVAAAFARSIMK